MDKDALFSHFEIGQYIKADGSLVVCSPIDGQEIAKLDELAQKRRQQTMNRGGGRRGGGGMGR